MDVQRKKGIIEVCVLAVLKKGPSYGYMIIRELEQCLEISESTLYPILKRLEQNGSLKTYRQEYNGRIRKYYELTAEGQSRIDSFLDEWDEMRSLYRFVSEQNEMQRDMTQAVPEKNEDTEQSASAEQNAAPEKNEDTEQSVSAEQNAVSEQSADTEQKMENESAGTAAEEEMNL